MKPSRLRQIIQKGEVRSYSKGEVFHSLDFIEVLYVVKSGYAKRYSINPKYNKAIESIYGPNHFFPLSPVFMNLFGLDLGQVSNTYVYQAMTDIELNSMGIEELIEALKKEPELYADLLYETGRRLKVDVDRLTSHALKDDHKKTVHQLVCLAKEFGQSEGKDPHAGIKMPLPLEPIDMAQQINIPEESAAKTMTLLKEQGLIKLNADKIYIPDLTLLEDEYLRD